MSVRPFLGSLFAFALLSACGSGDDGALDVALIGSEDSVFVDSLRLSGSAQHLRGATEAGLVTLNGQGEVVPALAERWIVTDDGLSFIFRLRDGTWPNGTNITAQSARQSLLAAMRGLEGTSLGQDLSVVDEVRAMAGRVIELRLTDPEPFLLNLLAQPELALRQEDGGTGPMVLDREGEVALLSFKPPLERGEPFTEDWQDDVRDVRLVAASAREAIALFDSGEVEIVLGGDLGSLPLVETGPLSSGTLRIDPAFGLFGLQVRSESGLLSNGGVREGLAMAIDRDRLLARYNIGGWVPTTRPVSPGLPGDTGLIAERWQGMVMAERRTEAAARIAAWRQQFDQGDLSQPAPVSIALGEGPGWDLLFENLSGQLREVGIALIRAEDRRRADLLLIDRVARYPAPRWFLNQFNCSLRRGLCSESADALVAEAMMQADPVQRATMMAQAEAELTLENIYIPIGSPLRWVLVRGSVDGFFANPYAFHPLPQLAEIPR